MNYIGIDMSKDTFHAAFDEKKVSVFKNTKTGIEGFIQVIRIIGYEKDDLRIGTESTGVYHLLFCRMLVKKGYQVVIINPLITHRVIASSSLQSVKNDRKDALTIRSTVMMGKGYLFSETKESGTMRILFHEYASLTLMKTQCQQQIQNQEKYGELLCPNVKSSFSRMYDVLEKERKKIQKKMKRVSPEVQDLLRSIPGIGDISSAVLIAYVGDINRFSSPRKLVAYCGMACRVHESGTSIKGKGFLTKRGHGAIRHTLFNAAFVAKRYNPECKAFFEKKDQRRKTLFCCSLCRRKKVDSSGLFSLEARNTVYKKR
jgi:transposase